MPFKLLCGVGRRFYPRELSKLQSLTLNKLKCSAALHSTDIFVSFSANSALYIFKFICSRFYFFVLFCCALLCSLRNWNSCFVSQRFNDLMNLSLIKLDIHNRNVFIFFHLVKNWKNLEVQENIVTSVISSLLRSLYNNPRCIALQKGSLL